MTTVGGVTAQIGRIGSFIASQRAIGLGSDVIARTLQGMITSLTTQILVARLNIDDATAIDNALAESNLEASAKNAISEAVGQRVLHQEVDTNSKTQTMTTPWAFFQCSDELVFKSDDKLQLQKVMHLGDRLGGGCGLHNPNEKTVKALTAFLSGYIFTDLAHATPDATFALANNIKEAIASHRGRTRFAVLSTYPASARQLPINVVTNHYPSIDDVNPLLSKPETFDFLKNKVVVRGSHKGLSAKLRSESANTARMPQNIVAELIASLTRPQQDIPITYFNRAENNAGPQLDALIKQVEQATGSRFQLRNGPAPLALPPSGSADHGTSIPSLAALLQPRAPSATAPPKDSTGITEAAPVAHKEREGPQDGCAGGAKDAGVKDGGADNSALQMVNALEAIAGGAKGAIVDKPAAKASGGAKGKKPSPPAVLKKRPSSGSSLEPAAKAIKTNAWKRPSCMQKKGDTVYYLKGKVQYSEAKQSYRCFPDATHVVDKAIKWSNYGGKTQAWDECMKMIETFAKKSK